jgi:ABC-type multidrug transport system fused ATPase/permease subunit
MKPSYFKKILFLLDGSRKKIPILVFLFLMLSILDVVGLGLIAPYISIIISPEDNNLLLITSFLNFEGNDDDLILILGYVLIMVFAVKAIISIWVNYYIVRFCQKRQVEMQYTLMKKFQNQKYETHTNRNTASYIHSIVDLSPKYAQNVLLVVFRMTSDILTIIAITFYLAITNIIALSILAGLLFISLYSYDKRFKKKLIFFGRDMNLASVSLVKNITEGMKGVKEIVVFGKNAFFANRVKENAEIFSLSQMKIQLISIAPKFILEFIIVLFIVIFIFIVIKTGESVQSITTTLAVFAVASLRLLPIANGISTNLTYLRHGKDSVNRLYNDINEVMPYKSDRIVNDEIIRGELTIKCNNVSFKYPGEDIDLLRNVSITISPGESIGIMGGSGSGKSTLINILTGFLRPESGEILVNGVNIQSAIEVWRSKIAYLPQDILIIDGSLKDNIALGVNEKNIDMIRIRESVHQANLSDWVDSLDGGLNTNIGEGGIKVSGGQRQRIALARAFYYDRKIIIMDESTSALDHETETEIINEINELKGKVILIIVAHRMSTIRHCDRVFRLTNKGLIKQ